jgi:hypothetical protein
MDGLHNDTAGRRRGRRERKPRAATAIAVAALVSLATAACGSGEAERPPSGAQRAGKAPSRDAAPIEGQVRGWIAYNDGSAIWAVNLRKAYFGVFSPSDYPDDAVRLADPAAGDPIAWSADGSRPLVTRRGSLFVLDADGIETRVTGSARGWNGASGGASISPDGTRVVYPSGHHPGFLELATMGDAPAEMLLESEEGHPDSPTFSPDGGRIAYIAGGGDHSNALWVIDADGTDRRKLAGGDWGHVDHLVWSPDGERLAFGCRCPAGTGVYTIRADGSRLTLVSAPPEDEWLPMPQWSPDGSRVALVHEASYTVGRPKTATLVVVGAEGGEEYPFMRFRVPRRLTIAWTARRPAARSFSR